MENHKERGLLRTAILLWQTGKEDNGCDTDDVDETGEIQWLYELKIIRIGRDYIRASEAGKDKEG